MNEIIEVAVAAFTHDWGKLFQRAGTPLSAQAERMDSMLCPAPDGRPTHRHVLWTNEILESAATWMPASLDRSRIQRLASQHHRPAEPDEWLIAEADRLASGHDRRPAEEIDGEGFRAVALDSVFRRLRLLDGRVGSWYSYVPDELELDDRIMPGNNPGRSLQPEYQRVADAFQGQLQRWPKLPVARLCDALLGLSERWLTTTPASTVDVPGVSLHDHSRLVAALAAAMRVFHRDTGSYDESAVRQRDLPKFLLVGGDLSGIQGYLFEQMADTTRGMARAYRARSFYLAMLTHAAGLRLLADLGLPCFNRVLDAGGRFTLLVPNTPQALDAISRIQAKLDAWMLERHAGRLTLILHKMTPAAGADFLGDRFHALYRQFLNATRVAKGRKLASYLVRNGQWQPEHQRMEYVHTREREQRDFERDATLGRRLPKATCIGLWAADAPQGLLSEPVPVFDLHLQLFDKPPDPDDIARAADFFRVRPDPRIPEWVPFRPVGARIPQLNHEDVQRIGPSAESTESASGAPTDDDGVRFGATATFEHLAQLARRSKANGNGEEGLPAIACLKADVDRLGMLFREGFEGDVSFGRVATLSRMLDLFFKGYMANQLADPNGPHRLVYTVFAGGDDLMLIGPWPTMLELACELRGWFRRFAAENTDVTLSAGIALGHPRFPIYALAEQAEDQLTAAKDAGRNRISVFNEILTWDEYASALDIGRRLDKMIHAGDRTNRTSLGLTPSFAYRLLQYARMAARVDSARQADDALNRGQALPAGTVRMADLRSELTWRSHLRYDLARNVRDRVPKTHDPQVDQDLEWLEELLGQPMQNRQTRQLKLAATYALYRNRGG